MKIMSFNDGSSERQILFGMITNKIVVAAVATEWKDGGIDFFKSDWARQVGQWCIDYFRKYNEPVGRRIIQKFEKWSEQQEPAQQKLMERFLNYLNREFEQDKVENPEFILDIANNHFALVRAFNLKEDLEEALDAREVETVVEKIRGFTLPRIGESLENPLTLNIDEIAGDTERVQHTKLIRYPGAMDRFFGDDLTRGAFFSFIAPEKRGKTWFLIDMAVNAVRAHSRVLFITVGDMTSRQIRQRLFQRIAGVPRRPGTFRYPTAIRYGEKDVTVDFEEREYGDCWNPQYLFKKMEKFRKNYLEKRKSPLKIIEGVAGVYGFSDITAAVNRLVDQDWVPDVIIIDYADVLALPSSSRNDFRQGTNELWASLRGLSQSLNCLVVTATQAAASSYNAWIITRNNFSEDKRKLAHVTGMVGLNQTHSEKRDGIYRLNWVVRRGDEADEMFCLYTAGNLALGRPVILSSTRPRVLEEAGEKGGDC